MAADWALSFVSPRVRASIDFPSNAEADVRYESYMMHQLTAASLAERRWRALPDALGPAQAVAELLDELLESVVNDYGEDRDIAACFSVFADAGIASSGAGRLGDDLVAVLEQLGFEFLTREPLSAALPHVRLVQPRVYSQLSNGYCGYYALSNLATVFKALLVGLDTPAGRRTLGFLLDGALFWKRRQAMIANLLRSLAQRQAEGDASFPWDREEICTGTLERDYAIFLLDRVDHVAGPLLRASRCEIVYLSDCGALKRGLESYESMQYFERLFNGFRASERHVLGFIIGLTTHWICIVAVKTPTAVEVLVLDSLNNNILESHDDAIWQWVLETQNKRRFAHLKPKSNGDLALYLQMLVDCREMAVLVARACAGDLNMRQAWLVGGISEILSSFRQHVYSRFDDDGCALSSESTGRRTSPRSLVVPQLQLEVTVDDLVVRMETWLGGDCPPKHVETLLVSRLEAMQQLEELHLADVRECAVRWHSFLISLTAQPQYVSLAADSPVLSRFSRTLERLNKNFARLRR